MQKPFPLPASLGKVHFILITSIWQPNPGKDPSRVKRDSRMTTAGSIYAINTFPRNCNGDIV
jgi:hypothetical protein